MYSESHCHFRPTGNEVYEKAVNAGVELVLTAGIDMASTVEAIDVACQYGIVKACVGIHPWYADEYSEENYEKLLAGPDAEAVERAKLQLDQSRNSLWSSQISRDSTCGAAARGAASDIGPPMEVESPATNPTNVLRIWASTSGEKTAGLSLDNMSRTRCIARARVSGLPGSDQACHGRRSAMVGR